MKKNLFSYTLALLTLSSAVGTFFSISRAIKIPDSSTWLIPMVCVSIFVILICAMSIFVRQKMEVEIIVAISFLFSILFAFTFWHFIVIFLSVLLALSGLRKIRNDLDLNVKISLWKSLFAGKFKIIFAISTLICSQYFFTITSMDRQQVKVPKFDLSSLTEKMVGPLLGMANPNFVEANTENLTVDQFIIQSQENNIDSQESDVDNFNNEQFIDSQLPQNLGSEERAAIKKQAISRMVDVKKEILQKNNQLVLQEGRLQLSNMVGKPLSGNEKVTKVFSDLINDRISSLFEPNIKSDSKSSLFPAVLTLILFLTIWPIGSLLSILWFVVIFVMFKLFLHFGLVEVKKIRVEREMIF